MPFTFSHPAIVLPLNKLSPKYVSMTGLIIGSMLPDFEYFIRMQIKSEYSHTLAGLFYFDLPLGIIIAILFHSVVKNNLIDNLPNFLYNRFSVYKNQNWFNFFKKNILIVCISIVAGAFSHIFWDMFTHPTGIFVELIPFLASHISINNWQIPVYKILQHGSTFVGALVIFYYIYKQPIYSNAKRQIDFKFWIAWVILMLLIIVSKLSFSPVVQIGNLIVTSISAAMLALIFTSTVWSITTKKNKNNV